MHHEGDLLSQAATAAIGAFNLLRRSFFVHHRTETRPEPVDRGLAAPSGSPFTFKVSVVHRGAGGRSDHGGGSANDAAHASSTHSTHVVEPGQSLWMIAKGLIAKPDSIAQVASEVGRLWRLNAERIGTGSPDLIYPGLALRLQ
jgi:hypothetical protein